LHCPHERRVDLIFLVEVSSARRQIRNERGDTLEPGKDCHCPSGVLKLLCCHERRDRTREERARVLPDFAQEVSLGPGADAWANRRASRALGYRWNVRTVSAR
jgi:hypothetical protein